MSPVPGLPRGQRVEVLAVWSHEVSVCHPTYDGPHASEAPAKAKAASEQASWGRCHSFAALVLPVPPAATDEDGTEAGGRGWPRTTATP